MTDLNIFHTFSTRNLMFQRKVAAYEGMGKDKCHRKAAEIGRLVSNGSPVHLNDLLRLLRCFVCLWQTIPACFYYFHYPNKDLGMYYIPYYLHNTSQQNRIFSYSIRIFLSQPPSILTAKSVESISCFHLPIKKSNIAMSMILSSRLPLL